MSHHQIINPTHWSSKNRIASAENYRVVTLPTKGCLSIAQRLNDFESSIFGPDFSCPLEQIFHWLISGDLFYSAVVRRNAAGGCSVLSVASVLLVDKSSRDSLIKGQIREIDLKPFSFAEAGAEPTFYYSSLVLQDQRHKTALFGNLQSDISRALISRKLSVDTAFGISTGVGGERHLLKSGFEPIRECLYLDKYSIYTLRSTTAISPFWRYMLHSKQLAF